MATATAKKEAPAAKAMEEKKPAARAAARTVVKKEQVTVKKTVAAKVAAGKPAETPEKARRAKLIRDSFTMPESEYEVLAQVKKACLKSGVEVKKSQLLRIGLVLLSKTEVPALKKLIAGLAPLKAGRPKKEK